MPESDAQVCAPEVHLSLLPSLPELGNKSKHGV